MARITLAELGLLISTGDIEEEARKKWDKQEKARRGLSQVVVSLMPLLVLVMMAVFYLLSAPHTAELLDKITPGYGWVAPIGFELGVLIVSALRELGWKHADWRRDPSRFILGLLMFISITINVFGGFIAIVTKDSALKLSTVQDLLGALPTLPATSQILLIGLVIPIGIVIPIMAWYSGETLIKLALGRIQLSAENGEDRWLKDRRKILQQALFTEAIKHGAGQATAGQWSQTMVYRWYKEVIHEDQVAPTDARARAAVERLGEPTAAYSNQQREVGFGGLITDNGRRGQTGQIGFSGTQVQPFAGSPVHSVRLDEGTNGRTTDNGRTAGRDPNARARIAAYFDAHPEAVYLKSRDLEEIIDAKKTTINAVQQIYRQRLKGQSDD